jgi:hypothetical protein
MKYFLILSSMLAIHFSLIHSNKKVTDIAASSKHALVAGNEAISEIRLDEKEMAVYAEHLVESSGNVLDTTMFSEIIKNAASVNTTAWRDNELNDLLLVQGRDEEISKDYLFHKFNLSGKKQIRYYTRFLNRYNETTSSDRNIYYFSKPIYDNSGKYAIVQWNNTHSGVSSGGIDLYYLDGSQWKQVGEITSW